METKETKLRSPQSTNADISENSRREFLSKIFITLGVVLSYGLLFFEGLFFIIPRKKTPPTIKIYAGRLNQYKLGTVQTFYDLEGNQILIRRDDSGFKAFSTVCPHLGCRVHWEEDKNEFFCPCHKGVFTSEGVAIAGPPADAGQSLREVPIEVDEASQIVYIEVNKPRRRAG